MTFQAFTDWQEFRLRHGFDKPVQRLSVASAVTTSSTRRRVERPRALRRTRGPYRESPTCGTLNGYNHGKCRCAACREAKRVAYAAYLAGRSAQRLGVTHGA